jgi:hypothetical protein
MVCAGAEQDDEFRCWLHFATLEHVLLQRVNQLQLLLARVNHLLLPAYY